MVYNFLQKMIHVKLVTSSLAGDARKEFEKFIRDFVRENKALYKSFTQPASTCSKLTIEALEQGVKYVQSKQ